MVTMKNYDKELRETKGRRLFRALRRHFKVRDFKFEWTDKETAYWDGETMFIRYDIKHPSRCYTPAEEQVIRDGFAYHEMGHKLYDNMKDYRDWIIENSSPDRAEWQANVKWPIKFVREMANLAADGRLEQAIKIDYPFTAGPIDFLNDQWAFIPGDPHERGRDRLSDFMEMFARRTLQLEDLDGFNEEVVELINENQSLITGFINTYSTVDCLASLKDFIKAIWPTYYTWAEEQKEDLSDENAITSNRKPQHDFTDWGSDDSKRENNQRVLSIQDSINESKEDSADSEDKEATGESPKRDFTKLLDDAEKEEQAAKQELEELQGEEVKTELGRTRTITNNNGVIDSKIKYSAPPSDERDHIHFDDMANDNRLAIKGLAKALETVLSPTQDEVLNNARNGSFRPHMAWKGLKCENMQMYRRKIEGKPRGNAYMACMVDTSGSTFSRGMKKLSVIEEMKNALTVILTAADNVSLPSRAFSFSNQSDYTDIYAIKEHPDRFTLNNKGSIGGLNPGGSNRDVTALQFLVDDLSKRSEDIRIGIMLSDGEPCFESNESEEVIAGIVKDAERKGIDILCLFVGRDMDGYECAKRMYGNRVILSRNSLAQDMKKQFVKLLQLRRQ